MAPTSAKRLRATWHVRCFSWRAKVGLGVLRAEGCRKMPGAALPGLPVAPSHAAVPLAPAEYLPDSLMSFLGLSLLLFTPPQMRDFGCFLLLMFALMGGIK